MLPVRDFFFSPYDIIDVQDDPIVESGKADMLIPNAVSRHSWNVIFVASASAGLYALRFQERLALDTRLHPLL